MLWMTHVLGDPCFGRFLLSEGDHTNGYPCQKDQIQTRKSQFIVPYCSHQVVLRPCIMRTGQLKIKQMNRGQDLAHYIFVHGKQAHTHACTHTYACTHTCMHVHTHTCTHACMHANTHTHTPTKTTAFHLLLHIKKKIITLYVK